MTPKCSSMFVKDMCHSEDKEKCNRIFRPWDQQPQDSTVSTTTEEECNNPINNNCDTCEAKKSIDTFIPNNIAITTVSQPAFPTESSPQKCNGDESRLGHDKLPSYQDFNYAMCPELLQVNLAQNLGLTSSDPLLLESLAQGYALEEYARVLTQEQQAKILNSKKQRPKKYRCPHCDVGFSNNGQLKGHIRIHTGERPFKCDEKDCGKTFTRNEELTRHKRIHSGLRPFPCTHCGKRFGRKDHLKKHSRTHFQPRGLYAVPVMLPYDTWVNPSTSYPFIPMFGY